jgi:hypothetical protein
MTFEQKNHLAYGLTSLIVLVAYLVWLLRQIQESPVEDIAYLGALLWAFGIGIVLNMILGGIARGTTPAEADKKDIRDREINRHGDAVGFYVFSIAVSGPLVLAMVGADQFWIANSLYVAYALTAVIGSAVKLVAYRRGW